MAVAVTGGADGAKVVATTHAAVRVAVVAGGAAVTLSATVVVEAGTLAVHLLTHLVVRTLNNYYYIFLY